MSEKVKTVTEHIINSYLVLGVLESFQDRGKYLSADKIINYLGICGHGVDNRYITRYKEHLNDWVKSENSEDVISTKANKDGGFKLEQEIPFNNYRDFLSSFLLLTQFGVNQQSVSSLLVNRDVKVFSNITKLYLAIRSGRHVTTLLLNGEEFKFQPRRFVDKNDSWFIEKDNHELILLADIRSVTYKDL